jgi:deazaflavin-dependent oxidoreductase (nitroreductase family)
MQEDLVATGRVIRLETQGRASERTRAVTIGYVEEPDGSLLVAARSDAADWARNLDANPACRVTMGARTWGAVAEPLGREDHVRAIRALILRYGTPSEDLGRGPSFRLRPIVRD